MLTYLHIMVMTSMVDASLQQVMGLRFKPISNAMVQALLTEAWRTPRK